MIVKTVQWNIGGGKLLTEGADPLLLSSYRQDGLDAIIALLREINPDIITLQETHAADGHNQPETIAKALGYAGWVNDEWAESHVEEGQKLGQGIITRLPIKEHSFEWFTNPNFEAVWEDGSIAKSHDKGRTRCMVMLPNGTEVTVQTLHTIPLRRFNVAPDSPEAQKMYANIASKLASDGIDILQADFNIDAQSLRQAFPTLFAAGFDEVVQQMTTTPKQQYLDHVLYKGFKVVNSNTIQDVLTDHYPVVTTFELSD
jgi:endonuclease/exonuclease/phosphatase family metal-dependent hydrolase